MSYNTISTIILILIIITTISYIANIILFYKTQLLKYLVGIFLNIFAFIVCLTCNTQIGMNILIKALGLGN